MQLPDFLEADDHGFIQVRGHRVGLHHVLRVYQEGYSPEMILDQYPTLPLAVIHKTIAFYLENRTEVDAYVAAHDREMERQMAQPQTTPTFAELKKRFEARQRTQLQSPQSVPRD